MASKKSNPPAVARGGLGNIKAVAAVDTREDATALTKIQAACLEKRFRLSAERAALVASLAFGRAA